MHSANLAVLRRASGVSNQRQMSRAAAAYFRWRRLGRHPARSPASRVSALASLLTTWSTGSWPSSGTEQYPLAGAGSTPYCKFHR